MSRRRGGERARARKARERAAGPIDNPAPPGLAYPSPWRPLSASQCEQILRAALHILEHTGMGEAPPVLIERACAAGAFVDPRGRLCFPAAMVEDCIDGACKGFLWPGRDRRHDIEVGGDRVYYGTGGAAVQTLDLDSGRYRPSTLRDLGDFARLIDTLPNVSWFTRCCIATDIEAPFELDLNTVLAMLRNTTKPIGTAFSDAAHVDPIVDLFDAVLGGEGRFRAQPFCKAHISPVISPLRYGEDAVAVALACIRRGVPINNIVAAQSGATAPATLAGMLASTLAETLAALLMVNVFERGYPMIFSNWPLVIDLRSGAFAGGGGEISLLNAASAQLSNLLGLPSGAACSMADAKAVDAQMGAEKALSALSVGLAGCNMIYESSGMMASLLGASFEAFVLDDLMLTQVYRVLRGVGLDAGEIDLAGIDAVATGTGHFLGEAQTIDVMQREYAWPDALWDRNPPAAWAAAGGEDAWQRANRTARERLAEYRPGYLDLSIEHKLRARYRLHD